VLVQAVHAMKDLVTEVSLEVFVSKHREGRGNEVVAQAMDSSHVSLVSLVMKEDAFSHFRLVHSKFENSAVVPLGVNLSHLNKALSCVEDDDCVLLCVDKGVPYLNIYIYSAKDRPWVYESGLERYMDSRKKNVRMTRPLHYYEMKEVFVERESTGLPERAPGCTVTLPSATFLESISHMYALSDTVEISVSRSCPTCCPSNVCDHSFVTLKTGYSPSVGGTLEFKHNGIDNHSVTVWTDTPLVPKPENYTSGTCRIIDLTFSSRYLLSFAVAAPVSERVQLHLSPGLPIQVKFFSLKQKGVELKYYLAPKLED
jgi:proliferating cell nuclear antigen